MPSTPGNSCLNWAISLPQITKIEATTFSLVDQLQVLNLHHNKIHTVAAGGFGRLASLMVLKLSHNRIENITGESFGESLGELTSLSLDNNLISELEIR